VPTTTPTSPATPQRSKTRRSRYKGIDHLSPVDRVVVSLMIAVPTLLVLWLVVVPAIGSVLLSFTNWDGIGPITSAKSVGLRNY
jgi:multiple sugar transport system permease protein